MLSLGIPKHLGASPSLPPESALLTQPPTQFIDYFETHARSFVFPSFLKNELVWKYLRWWHPGIFEHPPASPSIPENPRESPRHFKLEIESERTHGRAQHRNGIQSRIILINKSANGKYKTGTLLKTSKATLPCDLNVKSFESISNSERGFIRHIKEPNTETWFDPKFAPTIKSQTKNVKYETWTLLKTLKATFPSDYLWHCEIQSSGIRVWFLTSAGNELVTITKQSNRPSFISLISARFLLLLLLLLLRLLLLPNKENENVNTSSWHNWIISRWWKGGGGGGGGGGGSQSPSL